MLAACASEPVDYSGSRGASIWDKRRSAEVPETNTYKADLQMPTELTSEVELTYQAEPVEGTMEEESVEIAAITPDEDNAIMSTPENYYTMQLMASVDIDRVIRFAEKKQFSTQYIVATERDGVMWHVLLLDVYPDYQSALAVRDEISPGLKNEPWIRRVGAVQKLMR